MAPRFTVNFAWLHTCKYCNVQQHWDFKAYIHHYWNQFMLRECQSNKKNLDTSRCPLMMEEEMFKLGLNQVNQSEIKCSSRSVSQGATDELILGTHYQDFLLLWYEAEQRCDKELSTPQDDRLVTKVSWPPESLLLKSDLVTGVLNSMLICLWLRYSSFAFTCGHQGVMMWFNIPERPRNGGEGVDSYTTNDGPCFQAPLKLDTDHLTVLKSNLKQWKIECTLVP